MPLAPEQRLGRLLEGKLQLTDILGTGAYGVVYSATDVKTGVRYAVKCLSRYNADGTPLERRQVAYQQREINLHYKASAHANVVSLHKIVHDVDCIYVVLEYCPEGDLFLNITERGHYVGNDALAKQAFVQILDAVEHCHTLGIYHRDLKPENILVTDGGATVKLADFGLATAEDRSEDYGCGSTFYMSPECLEPTTTTTARTPYYMCAPNDVWSLGVILVNLTCGRNPWKQASVQDSTYRAYIRSPGFLKTILPLSEELNDILGRIFHPSPEMRITMPELRSRIMACASFTVSPAASIQEPAMDEEEPVMVGPEDVMLDDYDYEEALSPASDYSEDGSLASSVSTVDDLDEDFMQEQECMGDFAPQTYDAEDAIMAHAAAAAAIYQTQEYIPQHYKGPVPVQPAPPMHVPVLASQQALMHQQMAAAMQAPMPLPSPPPAPLCHQPKSFFPLWEVVKLVQQAPVMQHPSPFHQQVSFLPSFQGY